MHPLLIITVIAAFLVISTIFQSFLITKSYNFSNYELSKSKKPPTYKSGGFWAVFGVFLAKLTKLAILSQKRRKTPQKPPKSARLVGCFFLDLDNSLFMKFLLMVIKKL